MIGPTDFGNNPITAGTSDPYANPITVAVSETGGTGNATLSLNGGPASSSVQVTKSADSLALNYDGGGAPGYSFTVTLSASGVSSQSSTIAPLIASIGGPAVTSVSASTAARFEPHPGPWAKREALRTYTPTLFDGCTGIATIGDR